MKSSERFQSILRQWRNLAISIALTSVAAFAQAPRIDSVSPSEGPIAGGTIVTITGANLAGSVLELDRARLAPITLSDTEMRFQTPPHDNGFAVITASTERGVAHTRFLYMPPRLKDLFPGHITTVAGMGGYYGDGGPATRALVKAAVDLLVAPDGSIYFVEQDAQIVGRIRPDGILETVAGSGVGSFSGDGGDGGPALDAQLANPFGLTRDSNGNLYIVDLSHRVRRVDAGSGIITTVAGRANESGFAGDGGPAANALLNTPVSIVADDDGTLYIQEQGNARIRRIAPDGTISTYAGNGTKGYSGDGGPATAAQLDVGTGDHGALALDRDGNLYFAEFYHQAIRKVDRATGIITTVAKFHAPTGIAVAENGDLYLLAESGPEGPWFVRTDAQGKLLESWGVRSGFSPDGTPAQDAFYGNSRAIALDASGNLLICEPGNDRIRRIDPKTGLLETVAGGLRLLGENGRATATTLGYECCDLAILEDGSLLLGDGYNYLFRGIDANGEIHTLYDTQYAAGVPTAIGGFDLLPEGTIVFTDRRCVRRLPPRGSSMFDCQAGNGEAGLGFGGDGGPATEALLSGPHDVAVDDAGNIFVADTWNNRVRRVDTVTGVISTFAGTGPEGLADAYGRGTLCGDGGPAIEACLNSPAAVAVAENGTVFIGDTFNRRTRKVDPSGIITTFVQNGGGPMLLDDAGNLFSGSGDRIVRYSPQGAVTPIAGPGPLAGLIGDGGPANVARVVQGGFSGFAIDAEGNLFFADDRRIRAVRYGAVLDPPGATLSASLDRSVIRVTVLDGDGAPAPGVRIDFTAPTSGASCSLSNSFAISDADGHASVTCSSNCVAGTYPVTARLVTGTAAAVTITNARGPCRRRAVRH